MVFGKSEYRQVCWIMSLLPVLEGGDETCMALELIYITNDPEVAQIAEANGVDRIMVDLETLWEKQSGRNI